MTEILKPELDRRTLLRRAAAVGLLATPAVGMLSACVGGGCDDDTAGAEPTGTKSARPTRWASTPKTRRSRSSSSTAASAPSTRPTSTSRSYNKLFPDVEGQVLSQTEEIATVLQPRFTAGNPPDMVNNSGSKLMDFRAPSSQAGQVQDLTDLFAAPSVDIAGQDGHATPSSRAPSSRARSTASRTC